MCVCVVCVWWYVCVWCVHVWSLGTHTLTLLQVQPKAGDSSQVNPRILGIKVGTRVTSGGTKHQLTYLVGKENSFHCCGQIEQECGGK